MTKKTYLSKLPEDIQKGIGNIIMRKEKPKDYFNDLLCIIERDYPDNCEEYEKFLTRYCK